MILKSKKFWTAFSSVLVALAGHFGLDLDPSEITAILSPIMAYIVGQGVADLGKERAKIEKKE